MLSVDEMVERIDAVTDADLEELAGELFAPERLSAAGIGARALGVRCGDGAAGGGSVTEPIRVAVAGAAGRMGQTVARRSRELTA